MSPLSNAIKGLILKYAAGEPLTEPELLEFNAWKAGLKYHPDLADQIKDPDWVAEQLEKRRRFPVEEVWAGVLERIKEEKKTVVPDEKPLVLAEGKTIGQKKERRLPWGRWVAAACILGAAAGIYYLTRPAVRPVSAPVTSVIEKGPANEVPKVIANEKVSDKRPEYTTLTLGDQRRVVLDTVASDQSMMTSNHTAVSLGTGNQLTYQTIEKPQPGEEIAYNIFETGKNITAPYVLKLSEGSTIFVNAGSKVRYPVAFSGKGTRKVEVWGEAYFEVSRDAGSPFEVNVNGVKIEVLGTSFNVKTFAHNSEGHITLVEGRVKVTSQKNPGESYLLNPSEQVRINKDDDLRKITNVDISSIVEWKKREFHLDGKSFNQILREVAQWYRLKLPDMKAINGQPVGGILDRDLPVITILRTIQTLEDNKIRFSLKGDSLLIRQSP